MLNHKPRKRNDFETSSDYLDNHPLDVLKGMLKTGSKVSLAAMTDTTGLYKESDSESLFKAGYAPFKYDGLELQTYYTIAGDLKSSKQTPLVLVHGGPGVNGQYLVTHGDLTAKHDIPVVIYDQTGCGYSTHLVDKPCDFWTPELFAEQLEHLLVYLGIKDRFDLLGHSWGGILSAYFVGTRKLPGLRHLILVGSPASFPLMNQSFGQCVDELPERLRIVARKSLNGEQCDPEELKEASALFTKKFRCKLDPKPEPLQKAYKMMEEDPTVLHCMTGTSPFSVKGTLEYFSVIDKLPNIIVPTLLIRGENEMMRDLCLQPFFDSIAKVKWVTFSESLHMAFFEERDKYMELLYSFTTS